MSDPSAEPSPAPPESCLAAALDLVARGIPITLCYAGTKEPIGEGWQHKRWTAEEVRRRFENRPDLNLGVMQGASAWIDIEADTVEQEQHFAELFSGVEQPKTATFRSSRGLHRLYRFPREFAPLNTAVIKFRDLGVRIGAGGKGAHSVIPPSIVDGVKREWIDRSEPAELPTIVIQRILACVTPVAVAPIGVGAVDQAALAAMIEATKNMVDKNDGSNRLYTVACRAVEHNLSDAAAIATIDEYAKSRPFAKRWDDGDIIRRLRDAETKVVRGSEFVHRPQPTSDLKPAALAQLVTDHPRLAEPVVNGLLRRGETMNVIADPKRGKSWLAYGLALSACVGDKWLGTFDCTAGRVLIIDNELHPATLAHRIPTAADGKGIRAEQYAGLDVLTLRGRLVDLYGIAKILDGVEPGKYGLVILDALYRALPNGVSENDNASVAMLFNRIDQLAARLNCGWVNIHHACKGNQSLKSVTDVGAGAGAQSRAADAHLILREHEQPGCVVLESVVRSFPPVEPVTLRWSFPIWQPADGVDPKAIKGRGGRGEERQVERDREGRDKIINVLGSEWLSVRDIRGKTGQSDDRCKRLLDQLESQNAVSWRSAKRRGNDCREYRLAV